MATKSHRNPFLIGLIVIVLVGGGYYYFFSANTASTLPRYTISTVQRGSLISSLTESGQVIAAKQLDIKSAVSGPISALLVHEGDVVSAGTILAQLDTTDAQKNLRDAELNLQTAQLALAKIQKPADSLALMQANDDYNQAVRTLNTLKSPENNSDILQARDAVAQAQRDVDQAQSAIDQQNLSTSQSLQSNYNDAYTTVSSALIDLTATFRDLDQMRNGSSSHEDNMQIYEDNVGVNSHLLDEFEGDFDTAESFYTSVQRLAPSISRSSSMDEIYRLLADTWATTQAIAHALQKASAIFVAITDDTSTDDATASLIANLETKANQGITTMNRDTNTLQSAKEKIDALNQGIPFDMNKSQNALTAAQEKLQERQTALNTLLNGSKSNDITAAQEKVNQKKAALAKLQAGPDDLDIHSQELTIQQRQNAVQDARAKFNDYIIKAPFPGIIGKINIHEGDTVSNNTVLTTITTADLLAQISLNEVDVATVTLGDKATLTFDAIPDLSLTGKVQQIDMVGSVSQGVVSYNAQISFDTNDPRVKPGMSVSAAIITDIKPDVLLVPSGAVKTQGGVSYVQLFNPAITTDQTTVTTALAPQNQTVQIGNSNDTQTEIINGLQEGQQIIVQTLSTTTSRTTTQNASGIRIPGLTAGAGR